MIQRLQEIKCGVNGLCKFHAQEARNCKTHGTPSEELQELLNFKAPVLPPPSRLAPPMPDIKASKRKSPYSPPAFPLTGFDKTGQYHAQFLGMTQRQYYVGQLIQGAIAKQGMTDFSDPEIIRIFSIADRLIKFEADGK